MRERCNFECNGLKTSHLSASLEPCKRGVACDRGVALSVKPAMTSHLSASLEPCDIVRNRL